MKLNDALNNIKSGKRSINDFKYDKELILSLLDYDIFLYNSLSSSLKKDNDILESILSKNSIPFGMEFGFDKSLNFIDDEDLLNQYISIKLKSNYYRLFCLICNIFPDFRYNLKNINDLFIENIDQLIAMFSNSESQLNTFKMFFGLYNGNMMGHIELSSLLNVDVDKVGITIQEVYNLLCDDSRLKFELIIQARDECKIGILDYMYLNATNGLIEFKKMDNYRYFIECLDLSELIVYRLNSVGVRFVEQLRDDIDSILEKAGILDFKDEICDAVKNFEISIQKNVNNKRI